MHPAGSVAAIIPTFRRPHLLRRLVDSLRSGSLVPDEIIVVDNDPDGSVEPATLPPDVHVVHAGLGLNATGARNAGWRASRSDICIFVDDDNEVDDNCLDVLAQACRDQDVGLAGPVIYSGDQGTVWCAGLEISKWTGLTRCVAIGEPEPPGTLAQWPTDGVPDMYALRHEVLERVGGLDDRAFPMCGEEYDLAERVEALGLERIIVRDATVRHYGNVSENPGEQLVRSTMLHGRERASAHGALASACAPAPCPRPRPLHGVAALRPVVDDRVRGRLPPGQGSAGRPNGNRQSHRIGDGAGIPGGSAGMTVTARTQTDPASGAGTRRLDVVAVSWRDLAHPSAGGAEVLLDRVLSGLHERGHRVTLVCGGPVSDHPFDVVDAGAPIRSTSGRRRSAHVASATQTS